jgi:hypothetical protein
MAKDLSPRERLEPLIGQVIRDIVGASENTYTLEVVTDAGVLHVSGGDEGYLGVTIGRMRTSAIFPAEALEWMKGRMVKATDIITANIHRITFIDETQLIISSSPDADNDHELNYRLVQREDEAVCW